MPSKPLPNELKIGKLLEALPVMPEKKKNIPGLARNLAELANMRGRYERFRKDPYLSKEAANRANYALTSVSKRARSLKVALSKLKDSEEALSCLSSVAGIDVGDIDRHSKSLIRLIEDIDDTLSDRDIISGPDIISGLEKWKRVHDLPAAPAKSQHSIILAKRAANAFEELTGKKATLTNPNRNSRNREVSGDFIELLLGPIWTLYGITSDIEYCSRLALSGRKQK